MKLIEIHDYIKRIKNDKTRINNKIEKINENIKILDTKIMIYKDILNNINEEFVINIKEDMLQSFNKLTETNKKLKEELEINEKKIKTFNKYISLFTKLDNKLSLIMDYLLLAYNIKMSYFMFYDIDSDESLLLLLYCNSKNTITLLLHRQIKSIDALENYLIKTYKITDHTYDSIIYDVDKLIKTNIDVDVISYFNLEDTVKDLKEQKEKEEKIKNNNQNKNPEPSESFELENYEPDKII